MIDALVSVAIWVAAVQNPQEPQQPSATGPQDQPPPQVPRTGRATRADDAPTVRMDRAPEQTAVTWLERAPVTGDWLRARAWLWARGVQTTLTAVTDASVVAAGGVDPGATALRTLVDAEMNLDGERLLGWAGTRLYADLQIQQGRDGSRDTGDVQVYSNIDGPDRVQLAQLFVEHELDGGALRWKLGKFDANSDFAFVEHGFRFLHSSFGFAPTVLGFPTYPDPAFGGAVFVAPGAGSYFGLGIQDGATQAGVATGPRGLRTLFGAPGDLFLVGEAGVAWHADAALPGRFGAGAWRHTGCFERADGGEQRGTAGGYATFDQQVWRDANEPRRGLGMFAQYGWADPEVSDIEHYVGAGAAWTGPFAARPDDACGIGLAWAIWRDRPDDAVSGGGEVAVECFYGLVLTPWLRLKPDVQFLHDPGGAGSRAAAGVFSRRAAREFWGLVRRRADRATLGTPGPPR